MNEDLTPRYIKYGRVPVAADGRPDVHDGDTLRLALDLGHNVWLAEDLLYRLADIQAAELKTQGGEEAREKLISLVEQFQLPLAKPAAGGFWLVVQTVKKQGTDDYRPAEKKGSFGRYLVRLYGKSNTGEWQNLNQLLLDSGHAKPYKR